MLDSSISYYQSGLGNQLCHEITFNDCGRVIVSTEAFSDASYKISDMSLEFKIVTQPDLTRHISDKYQNITLLYDRVLKHRQIRVNKSHTTWNWLFNI